MPYFPTLTESYTTQQVTDVFQGYNHNLKIGDGEFFDMKNLTSSFYPLLANREKRSTVKTLDAPRGLLAKSKLAYIDGTHLYYDSEDITDYLNAAGFVISSDETMMPKQILSMGAYIVIYPDKLYINTENYTDCGSVEAFFSTTENSPVVYSICKADGIEYGTPPAGSAEPTTPQNGDLWIDTSSSVHSLKQYSATSKMWVQVPTVYTKISYAGIGKMFAKLDGVTISGCVALDTGFASQIEALNGSKIIYDKGDDYIVVVGLLDQTYTQESGSITISRTMPDLDFITEAENRLWGCKYGLVNGKTVNEIYCCALGDFKNWNQFLGLSTDSYVASVGTDGQWTGAVTYLGYPIFFKENCLHKVYISSSGAHQIVDTACRGVQNGSHNSLVVVNETLFYKSVTDICAYDGSLPKSASSQFGTERYYEASAGSIGDKYYVSMRDKDNQWHLFVLDTAKGFWHREDNTQALGFARCNGELYYIDADTNDLMAVGGSVGTPENAVEWSATTGIMGYTTIEHKYISRFNLRMRLPIGSKADMYIQYDSDGIWHHAGHMEGTGTKTFMLPVRPRRCDHFQFKIEGTGEIRIYSFARILERGSDE
jgi:hypothetical protein